MNDFELTSNVIGYSLALRGVDVTAQINGLLAKTELTQKYRNDTNKNLEIAYTFPLPVDGVLLTFAVQIGERHYQGQVMPRSDAEVAYEAAIDEGNSAFRIQEIQKGMYSATLGNVMPCEAVNICITYAETLRWSGKSIRYRLPTTIAPRYGEPTGMQPWQRPETRMDAEYPLSLRIQIQGALAKSAIACPSHKVAFKPTEDALEITLAAGATMDRDFVLEIENGDIQSLGISATARDTHVALLTLLPPTIKSVAHDRDTVIVLDCSVSMKGDSLRLAKEGVQLALDALTPNECFAILAFGDQFVPFDKEFQPANKKNLGYARTFVSRLGTLGGTEMAKALEMALEFDRGHPMDILLLTDGEAWNLEEITDKAIARGVRIFTMGIGSAVAEDTVRILADRTGGACELVSPTEDMASRIYNHFARMRQPRLAGLTMSWTTPPLWEVRPERACFAGDAYTVVAAFDNAVQPSVSTSFEFADQPPVTMDVALTPAGSIAGAIVRIAANARLNQLAGDEQKAWAVAHQLITDQTDCIITVVRSADERATDQPELQILPQMLPAGWGGTSTVLAGRSVSRLVDDIPMFSRAAPSIDLKYSMNVKSMSPAAYFHTDTDNLQNKGAPSNPYLDFLKILSQRSTRKLMGRLPRTKADLLKLDPPAGIVQLLDALLAEGHSEADIINAFLQALVEHNGATLLSDDFIAKVNAASSNQSVDRERVADFRLLLNDLWTEHGSMTSMPDGRYDTPAFHRKASD